MGAVASPTHTDLSVAFVGDGRNRDLFTARRGETGGNVSRTAG